MNNLKKKERFERVASRRVENILNDIKSLSKCSNKHNYEYTKTEINKMLKAIKEEIRLMEMLFKKNLKDSNSKFNF
jgi:light-regulated signal transduction histidine kinase (bacteriophytochrome)|tara:strand:+ start:223 stop:450 length:228 start_codon:yes stop_codon:yes gene_type:complete